ncbi:hypothetical protein MUK42_15496 [Musa troglodytarum]|uniref:Defective in cullin neddylation protein n=1 Tax=Musa troglodytarum TaxID=320322 RepID=A0A9E7KW92_9LILI|nr:hypothetical protein MUK42_15496 [Musa troglodytarum]
MESSAPQRFDIFEVFSRYCDIVSRNQLSSSKESLAMLLTSLEYRVLTRETLFNDIYRLMSCLDLSVDSRQFSCFYDFVFLICRENGQKNITVNKAITAWRLILNGRFRMLDQWCNFVEKHQRHNISEDTWQQLLAFSRCVNEDLEGYDPKGLNLHPGLKRKYSAYFEKHIEHIPRSMEISKCSDFSAQTKRSKQASFPSNLGHMDSDISMSMVDGTWDYQDGMNKHNSHNCLHPSLCAVEDCLSKGSEGYLSFGCCFHFDQKNRVYS